jgi:dTDP-4-amino-4,6-dideoxygalactose transaminase
LITTHDPQCAERLRVLRDHGQQPRYHHHFVGINSRLDTLQAAVLHVKLRRLDAWAASRQSNAEHYVREFARLGLERRLHLPQVAPHCTPVWNQFTIRVAEGRRDELQQALASQQIGSAVYYPIPLHLQKCFAPLGWEAGSLPRTEQAALEVLSLPIYPELQRREQDRVIAALAEFCGVRYVADQRQRAA